MSESFEELTNKLESMHSLFYQLWLMGKPSFDDSIKTAAVKFVHGEAIAFVFNRKFYDSLNDYDRLFVICHEMLHIVLNHGGRIGYFYDESDRHRNNIAMDIVVNHMLVDVFGFDRKRLKIKDRLCWIDSVFGERSADIKPKMNFEYYLSELYDGREAMSCETIDVHGSAHSHWIIKKIAMPKRDLNKIIRKISEYGKDKSMIRHIPSLKDGKPKKKWESVIEHWSKRHLKNDSNEHEQWLRPARRYATLSSEFILPTEIDEEDYSQDKIEVWFFQDSSGSCVHLADRFFKAARSLPKRRFSIKMFAFDTVVHPINMAKPEIVGGGGTSFRIIEEYIQANCGGNYPEAIFVVTDGCGQSVVPEKPERWFWFLSENWRESLPSGSQVYDLEEYE